jgi:tryptophan 2,3-dioxygenase
MKPPPKPGDFQRPILPGKGKTDYERYLRTDELLSLQKPKAKRAHEEEHTFQIVHQSSELLLRGAENELERAMDLLAKSEMPQAARLIRRANHYLDLTIAAMGILDGLTPYDYHVIRAGLGHGSGLQSPGFLAMLHIGPQLGEAFFALLKKQKLTLDELYCNHAKFFALHEIAELLVDFDQRIQTFRFLHLKLAQRIIGGNVIGTGGNPVDILRQRQEHSLYKELWDVRNRITEAVTGATGEEENTGHGRD